MGGLGGILGGLLGKKGGDLGSILSGLGGSSGSAGGGGGGGSPLIKMLLPVVGGMMASGGLQKLLSALNSKGMSSKASSWIGTGSNEPISGDQVREVLGQDEVAAIARKLGVSHEEAAQGLAEVLPQVVDKASPKGKLRPRRELDSAFEQLQRSAAAAR